MRVQFTPNELQISADTLAQHNRELIHEIARADDRDFKHMLQKKLDLLTQVQNKLVWEELELSTDEGSSFAKVLEESERALYFEIARTDERDYKHMLRRNLESLQSARQKITQVQAAA